MRDACECEQQAVRRDSHALNSKTHAKAHNTCMCEGVGLQEGFWLLSWRLRMWLNGDRARIAAAS
eukprot:6197435-Pleurochrysis_carterae.AAC.3